MGLTIRNAQNLSGAGAFRCSCGGLVTREHHKGETLRCSICRRVFSLLFARSILEPVGEGLP